MYNKLFSDIFNLSLDNFEKELSYQYSKEEKLLATDNRPPEKASEEKGFGMQDLLAVLSDIEPILSWNVSNSAYPNEYGQQDRRPFDLDELIRRIDAKIAQLEGEGTIETVEENNLRTPDCDDDREILARFEKKYCPQLGFSHYYCLLYYTTLLYKYCSQPANIRAGDLSGPNYMSFEGMFVSSLAEYISDGNCGANYELKKKLVSDTASEYVKTICRRAFAKNNWTEADKKHLLLSIQLVAFAKTLIYPSIERETAFQFSLAAISLEYANRCYQKDDYENGIHFSLIAFMVDNAADRQDAFNVLGLCAIEKRQYQLAYDAYFSWINMTMVGQLNHASYIADNVKICIENALNSSTEKEWRKQKAKAVAVMYGNFAYTCGTMYDNIEASKLRDDLIGLAKHYIELAIAYDPDSNAYYCSAGTIYYDAKENADAVKNYKLYYGKAVKLVDKVTALHAILQLYQEMPNSTSYRDYEVIEADFLHLYQQLLNENSRDENEVIRNARDLYVLLTECALLSDDSNNLKYVLLEIDNEISYIRALLRRTSRTPLDFNLHLDLLKEPSGKLLELVTDKYKRSYKGKERNHRPTEIAYYTSLKNLQFLFSETKQQNGSTINCLTMMHARYMNDPDEGLVLLQKLQEFLPKAPAIMRDELYDQKFVFLKSFTGLVDQLNMWTMYGSDRATGSDCNGCCVCIAPETFSMVPNKQNNQANTLAFQNDNDDYHLYSVAYMDGNKIFVDGIRSKNIERHYNNLRKLLARISKGLVGASSKDTDIISACLVRMLEKPMFLFKDKSYHLEAESRLIITRDAKDSPEIKKTPQEPPKLFINPLFQVFPEKILLGPKVENPDYWIPHLQLELSKFCEKWPPELKRSYKPTVRISRINIR